MRKQIGDLIYDTDKAEKLCENKGMLFFEVLYKTSKGRFFLYKPNLLKEGGDDIIAISDKKAKEFFNKHGDSRQYEKVFGRKVEEA
jgi:hypothetical protein